MKSYFLGSLLLFLAASGLWSWDTTNSNSVPLRGHWEQLDIHSAEVAGVMLAATHQIADKVPTYYELKISHARKGRTCVGLEYEFTGEITVGGDMAIGNYILHIRKSPVPNGFGDYYYTVEFRENSP